MLIVNSVERGANGAWLSMHCLHPITPLSLPYLLNYLHPLSLTHLSPIISPPSQVSHARRRRQKALARNGPESVDRALPVQCQYPPTALGCVPESYGDAVAEFLTKEGGRFKQASEGKGARGGGVDGGVMSEYWDWEWGWNWCCGWLICWLVMFACVV